MRQFLPEFRGGFVAMVIAAGVLLFGDGSPTWASDSPDGPTDKPGKPATRLAPVVVETGEVVLEEITRGGRIEFKVKVANRGERPARFVGVPPLCQRLGCIETLSGPIVVPPGQSREIPFYFKASALNQGEAEFALALYFDVGVPRGCILPLAVKASVITAHKSEISSSGDIQD